MMRTCHAIACTAEIPPRLLFCARHWNLIPDDARAVLESDALKGRLTRWTLVAALAVRAIALAEERDPQASPLVKLAERLAREESPAVSGTAPAPSATPFDGVTAGERFLPFLEIES